MIKETAIEVLYDLTAKEEGLYFSSVYMYI